MAQVSTPRRRWLSKREAAEYLGVSERWVKRAIDEGDLPYHKFRRLVRLDVRDLDAYTEAHRIESEDRR